MFTRHKFAAAPICTSLLLAYLLLSPGLVWSASDKGAVALVQSTTASLLDRIDAPGGGLRDDPIRLHAFVDAQVAPHFDFTRFARIITGKHWNAATSAQRERLRGGVRTRLVRTIAAGLSQYADHKIELLPQGKSKAANRSMVRMRISHANGQALALGYRLYESAGQWKIYDVVIDGISMLKTYQSQATAQVRDKGMDSFIKAIAE